MERYSGNDRYRGARLPGALGNGPPFAHLWPTSRFRNSGRPVLPAWRPCANRAHLAANLRAHRVAAHLARFGCVAAVSTLVGVATAGGNVGRCAAGGALLAIGVAWTLCCGQPFAGVR